MLFRRETEDARSNAWLGRVLLVRPMSFGVLTAAAAGLVFAMLAFFLYGEYTRKARVTGVIVPVHGIVRIVAPQAGVVISPVGAVAVVGLRLLSAPAASDVIAEVTSSNTSVASVQGQVVIHAGEQVAQVGIVTATQGVAEVTVKAGGRTVRLTVISGTPPAGADRRA